MQTLQQPIKKHGGKYYLSKWLISLFPKRYTHYGEVYFGGGATLLQLDPKGKSEFINDVDGELMNFWRVLQSPAKFELFRRKLEVTPLSEVEFNEADRDGGSTTNRAVRFFIRSRQSRQGLATCFNTLTRKRVRRNMNEQASSWLSSVEGLADVHKRLQRVVIFDRDALQVIRQQDDVDTFFYLDPPYMHETRSAQAAYGDFEMSTEDHIMLLETLTSIKGKFMLSGYATALYAKYRKENDWFRNAKDIDNKSSSAKVKPTKREVVWTNYDPHQQVM